MEGGSWQSNDVNNPSQSVEEVLSIIQEASKPVFLSKGEEHLLGSSMDLDDLDADADLEDIETSGDFVCPLWAEAVYINCQLSCGIVQWLRAPDYFWWTLYTVILVWPCGIRMPFCRSPVFLCCSIYYNDIFLRVGS